MSTARNVYVNDQMMPNSRRPIVITDDRIATGARTTHVRNDDPEALLRQYLRLIRRVRNQRRGRNIALRRADIETLANHLGWTDDQVLARLADLMGATSRQRATMLAVLATGASLITITSPAAAADDPHDELPIVVVHDDAFADPAAVSPASRYGPVVAPSLPGARRTVATLHDTDSGAAGVGGDPIVNAPLLVDEPPVTDAPSSAPAVDDDGNTVAVGRPPVPPPPPASSPAGVPGPVSASMPSAPPADTPAAIEPHDPAAASTPAIDDDGNTVAVGQPPVPPPSTGVDDDGNTVAVGQPPVPPPPPAP